IAGGEKIALEEIFRASGERVAVRSSAVGEDSAGASFAGQHATILHVTSVEALRDAIRQIHASAHDESALAYRANMGLNGGPRMAVVVQRMVDADAAGVLFTRNPVTGANERLIESAFGLGEAVVSGLVTPDRFRIAADGTILERTAARKELAIRAGGEVPLSEEEGARLSLDDDQLLALHELAARCEQYFGGPQDLEWAIDDGSLYLLQSRPITKVAEEVAQPLTPRRFTGLALAALLAPLNSTIIAVALPSIAGAFGDSPALVTRWLVTAYLVVSIIAQSPAGKLADLLGYSRVLTLGRAFFGLGALLAAFSPNLTVLAAGRVLMALGGAFAIPTVFAELRNSVPHARRGRIFGIFGAIMGAAAATGPLLGGLLTARFGWHSVFVVNVPVVLLSFVLVPPAREVVKKTAARFDILGSVLLGMAVLLLVASVERTDPLLLIATLLALAAFIFRELRAADPVLDVRLFARPAFAAGSAIVALQNLAMYSMIYLVPFLLTTAGMKPSATGRMLILFTAAMVLLSPIGGRLSDAIGPRIVSLTGALVGTAGAALFVTRGDTMLVTALVLMGAGIGISTSPSQAAAMSAVPGSQAGVASGALSTMRYLGGVIGGGLVALIAGAGILHDARMYVFPAVLFLSAIVALGLPGRRAVS
ncbi:MAG TPA: MFS transporter, partial [Thermoanaerobaculia bacterium]